MTDESIERVIDEANREDDSFHISVRPLCDNVMHGFAWLPDEQPHHLEYFRYELYLIYEGKICVSACHVMKDGDLHLFTKKERRRCGIMESAMRNVILPHLFLKGRSPIRVSYSTEASLRLLMKLGFTILAEQKAELRELRGDSIVAPEWASSSIAEWEKDKIRRRLAYARALLQTAEERLKDEKPKWSDELECIINEIGALLDKPDL